MSSPHGRLVAYYRSQLHCASMTQQEVDRACADMHDDARSLHTVALPRNQMQHFPLEVCRIATLEHLVLSRNQIEDVPPDIGKLTRLRTLALAHNRISTLPRELEACTCLRTLSCHHNRVHDIYACLGQLPIETLLLHYNQLSCFSERWTSSTHTVVDVRVNPFDRSLPLSRQWPGRQTKIFRMGIIPAQYQGLPIPVYVRNAPERLRTWLLYVEQNLRWTPQTHVGMSPEFKEIVEVLMIMFAHALPPEVIFHIIEMFAIVHSNLYYRRGHLPTKQARLYLISRLQAHEFNTFMKLTQMKTGDEDDG